MFTANEDIKKTMSKLKIPRWQIAYVLGVSEQTVIRWLRTPLSEENRAKVEQAIETIKNSEE